MRRQPVFLFPTEFEAAPFREAAPEADVRISGVGAAETAVSVSKLLREGCKFMVLAGIAGTYDPTCDTGESFAVAEERMPGIPEAYARIYTPSFTPRDLPTAVSNTVQQCGAEAPGARLENMEGAVFFALCAEAGVKFCQIRSVSNRVGEPSENWEADVAAESLARTLTRTFIKPKIMNKTKIILWVALAVIVIAAVALLIAKWRYWAATVLTWVLIIGVSFLAGWLTGRFGGKKRGSDVTVQDK